MFKTISPDSIKKILKCRRKFYYKKLAKVKVQPSVAMIDGRNFHTSFQHFFKYVQPDKLLQPYSHVQFTEYFYQLQVQNIPSQFITIPKYKLILHNFAEIESLMLFRCKAHFQNDRDAILSHWFPKSIEGSINSEAVQLNGRHDRIDRLYGTSPQYGDLNGQLVVIDFKSGNAPTPKKQSDGSLKREIPSEIRRTFAYYKQLAATKDDEVNYMCLVFPKDFVTVFEIIKKATLTAADKAKTKALTLANAGTTIDCFPADMSNDCFVSQWSFGCEYYDTCRETWTDAMLLLAKDLQNGKAPPVGEEE